MKRLLLTLACALALSNILHAAERVCFELKGEFGEEIKAIIEKYSKNFSGDLQIVREDSDLTPQERSFLESIVRTEQVTQNKQNKMLENGKKLYNRDCASCHGEKGEISVANQNPINTWSASDIIDEVKTYADQTFRGQSRFVKNQIAQRYTKRDIQAIGAYVESLKQSL